MQLYSKELLRLSKDSSGSGILDEPTHESIESNPICGDKIRWTIQIFDEQIIEARHYTRGCALCKASAILLFTQLQGAKTAEVLDNISRFQVDMHTLAQGDDTGQGEHLFSGLRHAPSRLSCVLLAWQGLEKALRRL